MTDTAAEPLIPGRPAVPGDEYEYADGYAGDIEDEADESALVRPGRAIWYLSLCASLSGLLFGYDTGVISSTLVSINSDLSSRPLTTLDKSLITSATSFLALLASPLTGVLADALGRKPVIFAADTLFIVGAIWQASTASVWGMIAGRGIVGIAVGSASFVVPLYIGELAPGPWRGRMVTVSSLFITGGQVLAYVVGWWLSSREHGWRLMVGMGALPAVVQALMLVFMPETPRWLVRAGKRERAMRVLEKVYEASEEVKLKRLVGCVLRRVEREISEEEEALVGRHVVKQKQGLGAKVDRMQQSFTQLIGVGGNRRALTIACMLQAAQQLCGFNSLMYFSATIFSLVGFRSPTLTSLSIASTNFLFTLVAFHSIDRIGRRRILLLSIPIMVIGLSLCALAFVFLDVPMESNNVNPANPASSSSKAWPILILLSMIIYVASYALGLGNVPWQQSELFPLSVRSLGSALATATNWGSNTLVGITFLPLMQVLSPTGTFAVYACVCIGAWVAVSKIYPETAGLELEQVVDILREGWGVEESVRRAKTRRKR